MMRNPVLRSILPFQAIRTRRHIIMDSALIKEGVTEEWLNSKAKTARKYSTVFYRGNSDSELDLSGLPKNSRDNIKIALGKAGVDCFFRS